MRIAAIAGAALALAGCNGIVSTKPLFFAADAEGQGQLRPGVWMTEKAGCAFDPNLPMDRWPGCEDGFVVRPGAIVTGRGPVPFLLAKGDPSVAQITNDDGSGARPVYMYAGLRPLKQDAQGRIIEFKIWPALCGPPPPSDPTGQYDAIMTRQPIEGLVLEPAKHDCVAGAQAPVRVSARASEAWNDEDTQGRDRARWVRNSER